MATRGYNDTTDGEELEKRIDIENKDYKILILDGKNDMLIEEFEPSSMVRTPEGYSLSGLFTPTTESIRILVLANWKAFIEEYPDFTVEGEFNLSKFYQNKEDYNFNYKTNSTEKFPSLSWLPKEEENPEFIPMFGLSKKVIIPARDDKFAIDVIPELLIDNIPMLRALAKLMVVDKTNDENLKILSVKMVRYYSSGRLIPDGEINGNTSWFENKLQVSHPSIPEDVTTGEDLYLSTEDYKTFIAYLPEIDGLSEDSLFEPGDMYLEVTLQFFDRSPKTRIINLGEYVDYQYVEGTTMDFLRNHRYIYNITSVTDNSFRINVVVENDWEVIHNMELE